MLVTAGGLSPLSQPAPCLPSSWSQYSPCLTFSWSLSACAVPPFQLITVSMYYVSLCQPAYRASLSASRFQSALLLSSSWYHCLRVFLPADITVSLLLYLPSSWYSCQSVPGRPSFPQVAVPPFQMIAVSLGRASVPDDRCHLDSCLYLSCF